MAEKVIKTKKTTKVTAEPVVKKVAVKKVESVVKVTMKKEATKSVSVDLYDTAGKVTGKVSLPGEIFGEKVNKKLLAQAVRVYLGADARIFGVRDGSDFAPMPISRGRGRLSVCPEANWINSGVRMQTSAVRFATRQLSQRGRPPAARSDL